MNLIESYTSVLLTHRILALLLGYSDLYDQAKIGSLPSSLPNDNITKLTISEQLVDCRKVVQAFPSLQSLSLELTNGQWPTLASLSLLSALESLTLLSISPTPVLYNGDWNIKQPSQFTGITSFVATSLRDLTLEGYALSSADMADLARCNKLTRLLIGLYGGARSMLSHPTGTFVLSSSEKINRVCV
jgi:hypothetical protein